MKKLEEGFSGELERNERKKMAGVEVGYWSECWQFSNRLS